MSSLVKPEYGPTLPELVGPRLSAWPRWAKAALVVLGLLVIVGALLVYRDRANDRRSLVVREPIAFNLAYPVGKLQRVAPRAGEVLRLQTPPGTAAPAAMTVRVVTLSPYRGDIAGTLPVFASGLIDDMAGGYPGFVLRGEGRARINEPTGYQIQFQFTRDGRTFYGRRTLLFKDEPGRARRGPTSRSSRPARRLDPER